jgi:hypothetical protein
MPIYELLAFLFAFTVAGLLAFLEFLKSKTNWTLFIIWVLLSMGAGIFGVMSILNEYDSEKADKKEIIDSTKSTGIVVIDSIKLAVDSTRKSIIDSITNLKNTIEKRTPIKELQATLDMCPVIEGYQNPYFTLSKTEDTVTCTYVICNIGNDHAYNIIDKHYLINYKGDQANISIVPSLANKSTIIPTGQTAILFERKIYPVTKNQKLFPRTSPVFIFFKIEYTNSKHVRMPPLRKIFSLTEAGIKEVNGEKYEMVEKDITSKGYW